MTTIFRLLLGVLIMLSTAVKAESITVIDPNTYIDTTMTQCIDKKGHITFTTLGCKPDEIDTRALELAKMKAEKEARAKAQAQAEEEARKQAIEKVGVLSDAAKKATSANKQTNSNSTSVKSSVTPESPNSISTTAAKPESGSKSGTRGTLNGDLTIGYQ